MKNALLLSGFAKSGKDTIAEMIISELSSEHNLNAKGYYLAYRLKKTCALLTGLPMSHMTEQSLKEVPFKEPFVLDSLHIAIIEDQFEIKIPQEIVSKVLGRNLIHPRQVMQFVGTEILRHSSADIHCIKTMEVVTKEKPDLFLITDCRFFNELEYFSGSDALFVKRDSAMPVMSDDLHSSEKIMFEIMNTIPNIHNNSTLVDLRSKAKDIANNLAGKVKK